MDKPFHQPEVDDRTLQQGLVQIREDRTYRKLSLKLFHSLDQKEKGYLDPADLLLFLRQTGHCDLTEQQVSNFMAQRHGRMRMSLEGLRQFLDLSKGDDILNATI